MAIILMVIILIQKQRLFMEVFYDRKEEFKVLGDIERQSARNACFTVVTGRRRIGKTELLKKFMEGKENELVVLHNVDFSVKKGEFVAIVGASGSGKSTLMNIIGCLDTADEGYYYIDGQDVSDLSEHDQAVLRNRKIGFIFQ